MKFHLLLALSLSFTSMLHAQLVLERDINQEPAGSSPDYFAVLGGALYFRADDGTNGEELYRYNLSTGETHLVANLRPEEESSGISDVIAFDGRVFFNARDGFGVDRYLYVHGPATTARSAWPTAKTPKCRTPVVLQPSTASYSSPPNFPASASKWGATTRPPT